MENGNKPAFSAASMTDRGAGFHETGLSKREYFAGLALQGVLAGGLFTSTVEAPMMAVEYADALLKVLETKQNEI